MAQSCGSENLMAGDWIKMRGNLWDDPRIAKLCDATDQSEAAVIGALYWLWAMADQHTADGFLPGLTARQIDRKTGVPGFANALASIGWMTISDEGVEIVNFDDHNGASAKKRCQTAKRVAKCKAGNAHGSIKEDNANAHSVTDELAGRYLEKEKEKEKEEERKEKDTRTSARPPPDGDDDPPPRKSKTVTARQLEAEGVAPEHARDWLKARGKAVLTPTAWDAVKREAEKAGITPAQAVQAAAESSWRGFKAEWVKRVEPPQGTSDIPEWERRLIEANERSMAAKQGVRYASN